ELRKAGMRQKLAGQPFQVLEALLERPQEIVTREELRKRLWPDNTFVDYDLALKKAVNRLREVLGDSADSPRFIETVPRLGYRFIAPVTFNGALAATPQTAAENSPPSQSVSTTVPGQNTFLARRFWLLGAIAALASLSLALAFYRGSTAKGTTHAIIKSLAVLPLKNLSGDPTQEYLADGMTEALIGRLSAIRDLRV